LVFLFSLLFPAVFSLLEVVVVEQPWVLEGEKELGSLVPLRLGLVEGEELGSLVPLRLVPVEGEEAMGSLVPLRLGLVEGELQFFVQVEVLAV